MTAEPTDPQKKHPASAAEWLTAFAPRRGLINGHLQTIVGNFLPRGAFTLPFETDLVEVDPRDGSRVLCHAHWHSGPELQRRMTLDTGSRARRFFRFALHCRTYRARMGRGLQCRAHEYAQLQRLGLSDSHALSFGPFQRCGSGGGVLHQKVRAATQLPSSAIPWAATWCSKFAGEWGARAPVCAVATVCPAIDLAAGSDALHEPMNRMYEWHFLRRLMRRYRRKADAVSGHLFHARFGPIRSLREFDDKIVARYCGFRDADDYYYRAASARVVDRIATPTLILLALDDPFIRLTPETRSRFSPIPTSNSLRRRTVATALIYAPTRATKSTGRNPPSFAFSSTSVSPADGSRLGTGDRRRRARNRCLLGRFHRLARHPGPRQPLS